MRFRELLKVEFMKVKRSHIVPLIFVAPLLVVISGVANISQYFTPGIYERMASHVYSKCIALRRKHLESPVRVIRPFVSVRVQRRQKNFPA